VLRGGFFFFFFSVCCGGRSHSLPAPGYSASAEMAGAGAGERLLLSEVDQRRRGGWMARPTELRRFFLLLPVPLAKLKPFSPASGAGGVRAWRGQEVRAGRDKLLAACTSPAPDGCAHSSQL
jgi:hypothetical protein